MEEKTTASRNALSEGWELRRKLLDFMAVPGMASYVNGLVSGKSLNERGHWAAYAADNFVIPLSKKLGRPLRMITLGCGKATIERSLVQTHGWPIRELVGFEYDEALRRAAQAAWSEVPQVSTRFTFFDFNAPVIDVPWQPDVIFTHHALHHATDIEKLLPYLQSLMSEDCLFIGSEFLGPTRFQVPDDVKQIIIRLNDNLPLEMRRDLRSGDVVKHVQFAQLESLMKIDPSESARSADLRTMLFALFKVVERKPMGGTLLRWLFQYRAGNFDRANPLHVAIASYLIEIEKTLIETRMIQSDDQFFVLKR